MILVVPRYLFIKEVDVDKDKDIDKGHTSQYSLKLLVVEFVMQMGHLVGILC